MAKQDINVTRAEVGDTIYKYRTVDTYSLRLLLTGEIYFASPIELNDPFDCAIRIRWEETPADYLRELMKDFAREDLKRVLAKLADMPDICEVVPDWEGRAGEIEDEIHEFLRDPGAYADKLQFAWEESLAESMSVFSLSRNPAHPLMWSHYSDGHRGFCVGLDYKRLWEWMESLSGGDPSDETRPFHVNYVEEMEELSPRVLTEGAILARSIVVKHCDWEYEEETRLIAIRKAKHTRLLPDGIVRQVIFGAKMPHEVRASIARMLAGRPVDLYEAVRARGSYELQVRALE